MFFAFSRFVLLFDIFSFYPPSSKFHFFEDSSGKMIFMKFVSSADGRLTDDFNLASACLDRNGSFFTRALCQGIISRFNFTSVVYVSFFHRSIDHRRLLLKLDKQVGGTIYWPFLAMNKV